VQVLVEEGEHIGLPPFHALVEKIVTLARVPANSGVDFQVVRLLEPSHFGSQRFSRRDGVVIRRVQQEYGEKESERATK
jgi:hypothetical protein